MAHRSGLTDLAAYHKRAAAILQQNPTDQTQLDDAERHLEWARSITAIQAAVEVLCVGDVTITRGQRAVRTIIQNVRGDRSV